MASSFARYFDFYSCQDVSSFSLLPVHYDTKKFLVVILKVTWSLLLPLVLAPTASLSILALL